MAAAGANPDNTKKQEPTNSGWKKILCLFSSAFGKTTTEKPNSSLHSNEINALNKTSDNLTKGTQNAVGDISAEAKSLMKDAYATVYEKGPRVLDQTADVTAISGITVGGGSGIYVYKVSNGDNYPPSKTIVTADGRWDWSYNGTIYNPGLGNGTVPLTSAYAVDRNSGKTDRAPYHIQYGGTWWSKWYDKNPLTKSYELTRDVLGDEYDAFNRGYQELFTPYSNPSTYFGGNTDMWMQLYSQNGTEITVKVYNDIDDGNTLPPSPPQKVWVNRALSGGNWHAKVYWEANIEPNMQYSGHYQIYPAWTYGTEPSSWGIVATIDAYDGQNNPVTSWIDPDIPYGTNGSRHLFYRLKAIDNSGNKISLFSNYDWILWDGSVYGGGGGDGKAGHDESVIIDKYDLAQNYPNPFNPFTSITYIVKDRGLVSLKVYDILGKEMISLVNEVKEPGVYSASFNGLNYPSGVYLYKINVNNFVSVKKMLLVK